MLDRSIAPPFTRSIAFELIQPKELVLANGLRVFIIPGGTQPVLKVELVIKAGKWFEKSWGASYFAFNLLSKGTTQKTSFEIAQIFDHYGAHLEISPGLDVVSISLFTITKHLKPTLLLLFEFLQDSILSEKEFEQLKTIYLQNLMVNNEKTSFQASKLLRKTMFGEHHPYGKELEVEDVQSLSRNQLADHFSSFGHDITLFVAGNIDAASEDFITETLSSLLLTPTANKSIAPVNSKFSQQLVKKDGSVQSSIRLGKKFIGRSHNDYAPCLFLNHILGGYFGSRLMRNIREEKGLSYGISSSINTLLHDNFLVIGADVNNENLQLTFEEIRKELKRLRSESISQEELTVARNHFIGSLQSEVTTPFAHAEKIKNIFLFGLSPDFYQNMINKIDRLEPDDLSTIASTYFSEESFFEVAVG